MHCRRVVATAFQFHRQRNGIATLATRTTGSTGIISSVTAKDVLRWFLQTAVAFVPEL